MLFGGQSLFYNREQRASLEFVARRGLLTGQTPLLFKQRVGAQVFPNEYSIAYFLFRICCCRIVNSKMSATRRSTRKRQAPRPFWELSALKPDKENASSLTNQKKNVTTKPKKTKKAPAKKAPKAKAAPKRKQASKAPKPAKKKIALLNESSFDESPIAPTPKPTKAIRKKKTFAAVASPVRYDTNSFLSEMKSLMSKTMEKLEAAPAKTTVAVDANSLQAKYDELLNVRETQAEKDLSEAMDVISKLRKEIKNLKENGHSSRSRATYDDEEEASLLDVYRRVSGIKMTPVDEEDLPEELEAGETAVLCTHIYKPTQTAVRFALCKLVAHRKQCVIVSPAVVPRYRLVGQWGEGTSDSSMITFTPVGNAHLLPRSLRAEIEFKRKQVRVLVPNGSHQCHRQNN